ncbi:MAG: host attachment protein [Kofleriaceae bacterium]|nr:host attachment protein [Kofleriaceae bacterium]
MFKATVAVVDASRARLFTFLRETVVEGIRERFLEISDLVNPARRHRPHEDLLYEHELDAAFARDIVDGVSALMHTTESSHLIVCASPKMLGALRKVTKALHREHVTIHELGRDLSKLAAPQIREHLVDYDLLPSTVSRRQSERSRHTERH